jgi:hypothetical protein
VGVNFSTADLKKNFDAICLTLGCRAGSDLPYPGSHLQGIHLAMELPSPKKSNQCGSSCMRIHHPNQQPRLDFRTRKESGHFRRRRHRIRLFGKLHSARLLNASLRSKITPLPPSSAPASAPEQTSCLSHLSIENLSRTRRGRNTTLGLIHT